MARDTQLEERIKAYLGLELPGSGEVVAKLADAAMRAFEEREAARMVRVVKRSEIEAALRQRIGIFSVNREVVLQKITATSMSTMPISVLVGQQSLDQITKSLMVELNLRLGIRPDAPPEDRTITLLD